MFRRLTALNEHFANSQQQQTNYNTNQTNWYTTKLPNVIPSSYAAPKELSMATQTINPRSNTPTQYLPNMFQIFRPGMDAPDTSTQELLAQCTSRKTVEELIANPVGSGTIRCGWLYKPDAGISQGWLGTGENRPIMSPPPPLYDKFYWNLEEAQKQIDTDRCKTLTNCNDLSDPQFKGCGFTTERSVGIPVKKNGSAKYPEDPLTNSATSSIITDPNSKQCTDFNKDPRIIPGSRRTNVPLCTPEEDTGLLSIPCFREQVIKAGCSEEGSLARTLALSDFTDPMAKVSLLPAFKMYNTRAAEDRQIHPEIYRAGSATQNLALTAKKQFNDIKYYTMNAPENSALGAAARDLCLQDGDFTALYDACNDIGIATDIKTATPEILTCLQKEFLKAGGTSKGLLYPSEATQTHYQSMGTYGAAKQSMTTLNSMARGEGFADVGKATEDAYNAQAEALKGLRGIVPDLIPERAPAIEGVEVFWYTQGMYTLLGVTIESAVPIVLPNTPIASSLPNELKSSTNTFVVITDIRVPANQTVRFSPSSIELAGNYYNMTFNTYLWYWTPELYETESVYSILTNKTAQTPLVSKACWALQRSVPNVVRVLYGGSNQATQTFRLQKYNCNQLLDAGPIQGAMTREKTGPFYMFEPVVVSGRPYFADLRIPERVLGALTNATVRMRDEKIDPAIPGTRGYVEMGKSGTVTINNISLHAWSTVTFVIAIKDIPVTGCYIWSLKSESDSILIWVERNGLISVSTRVGSKNTSSKYISTKQIQKGSYIMFALSQIGPALWSVSMYDYELAMNIKALSPSNTIQVKTNNSMLSLNSAEMIFGDIQGLGLIMNVSWVHFFNNLAPITAEVLKRDALNDWKVTLTNQDN